MKKLLGIVVLGLLLSTNAFAKDRYADLITKSKTGKGDTIIEVFNELNFAFELEISFIEDCLYELKLLKKLGEKCSKMNSRREGLKKLWQIPGEPNFNQEMLKIVKEVDSGKRSKTEKTKLKKIMEKNTSLQGKSIQLMKEIVFLIENL